MAEYITCSHCSGKNPAKEKCVMCHGRGILEATRTDSFLRYREDGFAITHYTDTLGEHPSLSMNVTDDDDE